MTSCEEGSAAASPQRTNQSQRKGAWALWVGVVIMFLLVITAWTVLINIAKDNPVQRIDPNEATKPVAAQIQQPEAKE